MQIGRSVAAWNRAQHLLQELGLVDERDAGVDVEHVRAGLGLGDRVRGHRRQVVVAQLLGEDLAPRRVDALADDAEGLLGPDRDGARCDRLKSCSVRASSEAAGCEICNLPKEARS
jgi:hypothetical protein